MMVAILNFFFRGRPIIAVDVKLFVSLCMVKFNLEVLLGDVF